MDLKDAFPNYVEKKRYTHYDIYGKVITSFPNKCPYCDSEHFIIPNDGGSYVMCNGCKSIIVTSDVYNLKH